MIRDEELPELATLRRAEAEFRFRTDFSLAGQVVASGNDEQPIHRWFKLKESFSPKLLAEILKRIYPAGFPKSLSILDPFVGVGTTLLAAEQLARDEAGVAVQVTGVERNPFILFAAKTKAMWRQIDFDQLLSAGSDAIEESVASGIELPPLSSITTGRCITRHVSKRLLAIQRCIRQHTNEATQNALLLGLAAGIEPLSKIRKDGRALRIVERSHPTVRAVLYGKWSQICSDCRASAAAKPVPSFGMSVVSGDGRDLPGAGIADGTVDLVFTSPPYPNNIDYTEVYKLELWLLGFVRSGAEFLALRKTTFRSHPTCAAPNPPAEFGAQLGTGTLQGLLGPVLERAKAQPWRHRLFEGYFSDMLRALAGCYRCLRAGGHAVFVVGNSLHGGGDSAYLVPTDLVIADMARGLGFETTEVIIARNLRRRLSGNHFLRESIVVMRKPSA